MEQIKNYLSQIPNLNKVIILAASSEFQDLKKYLVKNNTTIEILENQEEIFNAAADAVIFDYDRGETLLETTSLQCDYLIGRMRRTENYFPVWENYRTRAKAIYIERSKGLDPQEVTPDRPASEILQWNRGSDDIELSVIIPVYNVATYLPKCIESLIAWEAPYVEYLFVNDGSTDVSSEIIKGYGLKDKRIRLIEKENGGCASARNKGLAKARGRYVGFVDSDDFVDETMLQKLFARVLMGGYDISYCGYQEYIEETGRCTPVMNDCMSDLYTEGTWRRDKVQLLAVKTRVAIWRCIYSKALLEKEDILFHEELKRFDDLPFRVEVLFTAASAVCVPEHLYFYRLGRNGQDVSCTDDRLFVHFDIFEILDEFTDRLRDTRLEDLLQIVKIHTHGYGLSRIEKRYKKKYAGRAVRQLDRNMGYLRTLCLILMYTGKGNIGWYTRVKIDNRETQDTYNP